MRTVPAPTVTQVATPLADKLRQRLTGLRSALGGRFASARAAFVDRYAFENAVLAAPAVPEPRTLVLCGFLFPLGGAKPVALYEGHYTVSFPESGTPALGLPKPGAPAVTWLRLERDFVEIVDDARTERFHTNDTVTLGSTRFLVKLVDPACRISRSVALDAEGVLS